MYSLSRICLIWGIALGFFGIALAGLFMGPVGWIVVGFICLALFKKRKKVLTTLGSACWASKEEMRAAGMFEGNGLILGRVDKGDFAERIKGLFRKGTKAEEACRHFFAKGGEIVRVNPVHALICAPTGVGKGVSFVISWLLSVFDSAVVIDFKGELYRATAWARRKMGHQVVCLDPFRIATQHPDTFDPVDFISRDSPLAPDDCNAVAEAMVVRTGQEKERHWNDKSAQNMAGALAVTVVFGQKDKGTRNLQRAAQLLSNPEERQAAIDLMKKSPEVWNGLLPRLGGKMGFSSGEELSSVMSVTSAHLGFLDTLAVRESTSSSSFDPHLLPRRKMTCYLVLPPEHMATQRGLLRLWVSSLMRAVMRNGLQEKNKVHFILDEAAQLGHMKEIEQAVGLGRGYGIRCQFYYQSAGQLHECWPTDHGQTLLSNTTQVFFGVNDYQTAELVSNRLGQETIVVRSGNTSTSRSRQTTGHGAAGGESFSTSSSRNWQHQARKLMNPDEVMALPSRMAITFVAGMRPTLTRTVRFFEERSLFKRQGWLGHICAACGTLAKSVFVLIAGGLMAYAAVKYASEVQNVPTAGRPGPAVVRWPEGSGR